MSTTTLPPGRAAAARDAVPSSAGRAEELASFLRSRRSRLQPEDVGLPRGRRRRTRGLRREEVAQLAGVSTTWYTWLEQARPIRTSDETLHALAAALRLTAAERVHLFLLALGRPPEGSAALPETDPAMLQRLLDAVGPVPAYAMGPLWELLAWNRAAAAVFALDSLAPADRNMLWYIFACPEARRRLVDWEGNAQRVLAQFRAGTARLADDAQLIALVQRLHTVSAEFAAWWPRHDVLGRRTCRKEIRHPEVGRLVLEHNALVVSDVPDLKVVLYAPLDEDGTPEKLERLLGRGAGKRHEEAPSARWQ
jgi:transcriptional regulator with XRE-family HTH domain